MMPTVSTVMKLIQMRVDRVSKGRSAGDFPYLSIVNKSARRRVFRQVLKQGNGHDLYVGLLLGCLADK